MINNRSIDSNIYKFYKEKFFLHKQDNENIILLVQVGDFYELYDKYLGDGEYELGIIEFFCKKTNYRMGRKSNGVAMAGCPLASDLDKIKEIFNNEGYVVIDYVQEGKGKNIKRILNNISTPGTCIKYSDMYYNEKTNNTMVVWLTHRARNRGDILTYGLSNINIITGDCNVHESTIHNFKFGQIHNYDDIETFYSIFNPNELIFIHNFENDNEINIIKASCVINTFTKIINYKENNCVQKLDKLNFRVHSETIFKKFYDFNSFDDFLDVLDLYNHEITLKSFSFLLNYIHTYNSKINTIKNPIFKNINKYIKLRNSVLKQLNIIDDNTKHYNKSNFNCLINLINKCKTSMGRRKLKSILLMPIMDINYLNTEYNILEYFINKLDTHTDNINILKKINDIDFIYRKFNEDKFSPYDLLKLFNSIKHIHNIYSFYSKDKNINEYFKTINNYNDNDLININNNTVFLMDEMEKYIDFNIIKNYNNDIFTTNFFKKTDITSNAYEIMDNWVKHKNELNNIKDYLSKCIDNQMIKDKGKTDKHENIKIHTPEKTPLFLKLSSTKAKLLKKYLNNSNLITDKNFKVLSRGSNYVIESARLDKLYVMLQKIENKFKKHCKETFLNIIHIFKGYSKQFSNITEYISIIDTLITKAVICNKYNYCRPIIQDNDKSFLDVKGLRHPLVEHLLNNEVFTPNDICLGKDKNDTLLIYGVNAVGKSVLMKSIGLCIFLAQTGMFVPATQMFYKPYTQIFTRILGNDNMFKGQSTFMVEMHELCTIINNADHNSLILGDELCSGTESISAISLFLGSLNQISNVKSSCIFTTHYHQLSEHLDNKLHDNIKFKHMSVRFDKKQDIIIYDRKLKDGTGPNCYGLEVCKGIGFDNEFIQNCFDIKNKIFNNNDILNENTSNYNSRLVKHQPCEICKKKPGTEVHHLNPQKNANKDGFIGSYHKNHIGNIINICKECHENITKHDIIYKKFKTNKGYKLIKQ